VSTPAITGARPPQRVSATTSFLLAAIVALIVFVLIREIFVHHDTKYETIATQMTQALQNNDLAGVEKFQNAETATLVTHAIVGRDADAFRTAGQIEARARDDGAGRRVGEPRARIRPPRSTKAWFTRRSASIPRTRSSASKYTLPTAQ